MRFQKLDISDDSSEMLVGNNVDMFSQFIWPLKTNRLNWSGFMQMFEKSGAGDCWPGKSSVTFLPMINMDPSHRTCINTTLHFVSKKIECYPCVEL